jgi:hypothetical protein
VRPRALGIRRSVFQAPLDAFRDLGIFVSNNLNSPLFGASLGRKALRSTGAWQAAAGAYLKPPAVGGPNLMLATNSLALGLTFPATDAQGFATSRARSSPKRGLPTRSSKTRPESAPICPTAYWCVIALEA